MDVVLSCVEENLEKVLVSKFKVDLSTRLTWIEILGIVKMDPLLKDISEDDIKKKLSYCIKNSLGVERKKKGHRGIGFPLALKTDLSLDLEPDSSSVEVTFESGIEDFVKFNLQASEDSLLTMQNIQNLLIDYNPSYGKLSNNNGLGRTLGEVMSRSLGIKKQQRSIEGKATKVWPVKYVPTSGLESDQGPRLRTRRAESELLSQIKQRSCVDTVLVHFSPPPKQLHKIIPMDDDCYVIDVKHKKDCDLEIFPSGTSLKKDSIKKLEGLSAGDAQQILLSFIPLLGARYSVRFPKHPPYCNELVQFGARVNGLDAFFHFGFEDMLVHEDGSWGKASPCPIQARSILLFWLQQKAQCKAPLSQVAGELIVRSVSQGSHSDSPKQIVRTHTLDIGGAGCLQLLNPNREVKGSYSWENSQRSHFGKVGFLPGSSQQGRVVIVFREYYEPLYSKPYQGKEKCRWRANELLFTAIQSELGQFYSRFATQNSKQLCESLVSSIDKLQSMKWGGYNAHEGIGYAPNQSSPAGKMNPLEWKATFPNLQMGEPLPNTFILPFGDKQFLWGMGFHRDLERAVKWNEQNGLYSIRLNAKNVNFLEFCPAEKKDLEVSYIENWICSSGCCGVVPLNDVDRQSKHLLDITKMFFRPFLYILFEPKVYASQILGIKLEEGALCLSLEGRNDYPHSVSESPKYPCKGIETKASLISFVENTPDKYVTTTYKRRNATSLIAYLKSGEVKYPQCDGMEVDSPNSLCNSCQKSRSQLNRSKDFCIYV
jgi:hypothetical protein